MTTPLPIAQTLTTTLELLPRLANRHGLIAGATGTGKTVTLQKLAESFSQRGVPIFLADVKGDLSGLAAPGSDTSKLRARCERLGIPMPTFAACPVVFWDVFGSQGHPVRTTLSEMGPLLLARLLNLNETQESVLALAFKVADDQGWLLLDLKDLRALLQHLGENARSYNLQYGTISAASIGAIQRALLALESQGGAQFFGEPALNLDDLLQTDARGQGVVNILCADKLLNAPKLYATFLLWLLAELFERLPEVGDLEKPKLVFFFDEAHLLFNDAPSVLLEKIEQVVRLIRSKGVGVYFISQSPLDIPEQILGQLGNRVQHALRAFTPRDQKAVRAVAETFRANPQLDVATVITELAVGEALISFLDEHGRPHVVERAFILPPGSQIGALTPAQRQEVLRTSPLAGVYEQAIDRDSAYEMLLAQAQDTPPNPSTARAEAAEESALSSRRTAGRSRDGLLESMTKSAVRTIGAQIGRELIRGVLGSLLGGRRRR